MTAAQPMRDLARAPTPCGKQTSPAAAMLVAGPCAAGRRNASCSLRHVGAIMATADTDCRTGGCTPEARRAQQKVQEKPSPKHMVWRAKINSILRIRRLLRPTGNVGFLHLLMASRRKANSAQRRKYSDLCFSQKLEWHGLCQCPAWTRDTGMAPVEPVALKPRVMM
jgi:hypothetical protein